MRILLCALLVTGTAAGAQTVTLEEGLAAWDRIYAVASHPRCTNCHVGAQDAPMWEGLSYGAGAVHGMGIKADATRIGAESIPCRTCHLTAAGRDVASPAAPQIDEAWQLPPVEMDWLGEPSEAVCAQLRDPDRNGGADAGGLVDHLENSAFVAWGFAPGPGRTVPPGSIEDLAAAVLIWDAAGMPCR